MNIIRTAKFKRQLQSLPQEVQDTAEDKISLASRNLYHPSLKAEKRCPKHWRICVTSSHRIMLEKVGNDLHLLFVGDHDNYTQWIKASC